MIDNKQICTGYLRANGKKGIRNKLLVIYTVDCASFVAQKIASHFHLLGEDVDVVGSRLCFDNQTMINRLLAFSRHPNVGATLVVGMGCEFTQAEKISNFAKSQGRPSEWFQVQSQGGTRRSIEYGISLGSKLLTKMALEAKPVEFYLQDLMVGLKCGGSDFTSGLTANFLLGCFSDQLIQAGGTVIFEEPGELLGLRDYLVNRAATPEASEAIHALYEKILAYGKASNMYHISPGNFQGGLSTIEEKSIGAVAKSGSSLIQGVLKIAQTPPHAGLWIMDRLQDYNMSIGPTVASDAGALMELITLGCHVCMLTTGRGHVIGTPIAPTIKITGNPETYAAMSDDIDFDASCMLLDNVSTAQLTDSLMEYTKKICLGKPTKAELLGHYEYEMLPCFQTNCP